MADTQTATATAPTTFTALDRLKAAVAGVPRGYRGPAGEQRHVEVGADDVAAVAGRVQAKGSPTQVVTDLHKGCTHRAAAGRLVACQADDIYHLIDQAGPEG